ncbi:hypothetical protein TNCV_4527471 [Trichonephila clavipes]|nr:hypothetical protein TNCV_4527471 [Trichonephila clavipes]
MWRVSWPPGTLCNSPYVPEAQHIALRSLSLYWLHDFLRQCVQKHNGNRGSRQHSWTFSTLSDTSDAIDLATPLCLLPLNQSGDSPVKASPNSDHIHNLDMEWRDASRSSSQRCPASFSGTSAQQSASLTTIPSDDHLATTVTRRIPKI